MNYLIKGKDTFSIQNKIKELIKDASQENGTLFKFDGSSNTFNMNDLLECLNTFSFFSEHKIVLYKDPDFLNKTSFTKEEDINSFINYLENPNPDIDLIIYGTSFSNYIKYSKKFNKLLQVFTFEELKYYDYVKNAKIMITQMGLKLDNQCCDMLINLSNLDLELLKNNIIKLKIYNEEINKEVIDALVEHPFEDDVFELTNALFNKDISKSLEIINEFFEQNIAPQYLISVIASQVRFLNQISYLKNEHYTIKDIVDITKAKEYRISKSFEIVNRFNKESFMLILNHLANLDQKLKTDSNLDLKLRFELFIIEMIRG